MADEKKDFKKPSGPTGLAPSSQVVSELSAFLVALLLLGYILARLFAYLDSQDVVGWDALINLVRAMFLRLRVVAIIVSVGSIIWLIYTRIKMGEVVKQEQAVYGTTPGGFVHDLKEELEQEPLRKENEKWQRVVSHVNSDNPSDWRQAIIEADVILEEYLRTAGYHGDSVGDMLKAVEPGEIVSIDAAWEAHKVRNRIAHTGGDFQLTDREAKRVVALFEQVFKEVEII